jgi:hypothetical protein
VFGAHRHTETDEKIIYPTLAGTPKLFETMLLFDAL